MAKLIILCGIPGAGKSSYAQELLKSEQSLYPNIEVVIHASDTIREELYGDEGIQGDAQLVFKTLHYRVHRDLCAGKTVIYDATNVTRKTRRIARKLAAPWDTVECHIVWAPIDICIKRDLLRKRVCGEEVINKIVRRWQSPWEDEDFNRILVINTYSDFDQDQYINEATKAMMIPHDNPHHTLDVFSHCEQAHKYLLDTEASLPLHIREDSVGLQNLKVATYWHDIGKPYTKFYKKLPDSEELDLSCAHYYDHHCVGGYMAYGLSLPREITSREQVRNACFISWLISNHMEPFFNSKYYQGLDPALKAYIIALHKADTQAH